MGSLDMPPQQLETKTLAGAGWMWMPWTTSCGEPSIAHNEMRRLAAARQGSDKGLTVTGKDNVQVVSVRNDGPDQGVNHGLRRFIPTRTGQDLQASYSLHEPGTPSSAARSKRPTHGELNFQRSEWPRSQGEDTGEEG